MVFLKKLKNLFLKIKPILNTKKGKVVLAIFIVVLTTLFWYLTNNNKQEITYQTSKATKETLITSIEGSGTINSGNSTDVQTKVSGIVKEVYVTNGDIVEKGQQIALVELDEYALERQNASWVDYLETLEDVKDAEKAKVSADIAMWEARQDILDAEENIKYYQENPINQATNKEYTINEKAIIDKSLDEANKAYSASEVKYKDADAKINDYNTKVNSALRDYQQNSAIIYTPTSGVISDLTLAPNVVVAASSSISNTSGQTIISAQTVGKINNPTGQIIATITLSEVDIIKVKANQKVTLTLDAYTNKTFTGKVLGVNTSGTVSSGVTSYPVTILLDKTDVDIYPNMAVNASIIISIKADVIVIPTTAITTVNNESTVQIKKNNEISTVAVELGESNDTQTEIISGINEGDEIITSVIDKNSSSNNENTTSPFSGVGSRNSGVRMPMGGF